MSGSEIKNTLTLDVSKFTTAIEKATANLETLDSSLKSVGKVAESFEKSVSGLGTDIGTSSEKFKLLDQTLNSLITKLANVGTNGFDSLGSKSRKASQDVESLVSASKSAGNALASVSDQAKQYGTSLDMLRPKIAEVGKSEKALSDARKEYASLDNKSSAAAIEAKIKVLEAEKAVNAERIQAQRKLADELEALEQKTRNDATSARRTGGQIKRNRGAEDPAAIQSYSDANRLSGNADFFKQQTLAAKEYAQALQAANEEIAQSIPALHLQATEAEKAYQTQTAAAKEAARAAVIADQQAREAEKEAAKQADIVRRQEEQSWREYQKAQREQAAADARAASKKALEEARSARAEARAAEKQANEERKAEAQKLANDKRDIARQARAAEKAAKQEAANFSKMLKEEQQKWDKEQADLKKQEAAERVRIEREASQAIIEAKRQEQAAAKEAAADRMRQAREAAAFEKQQAEQTAAMWKSIAAGYGAFKIGEGFKGSVSAASAMDREKVTVGALNLPKDQEDGIFSSSKALAGNLKFISTLDAIQARMSAISSLGHNDAEVIDQTLEKVVKASHNMEVLGFMHGDMQSNIRNMYGVVEMRQQTANPQAANNTFETIQKITTGTAGKVTAQDLETVLRRLGTGAGGLSDNGLVNMAAIIDQFKISGGEGGGSGGGAATVGTAFKMMQAYSLGKTLSNSAVKELSGAGVMNTAGLDLTQDKAGILRDAKHGGFKDADLWMKDPVAAVQKIMPQIIEYTQREKNRGTFYQGRDMNDSENQMLAVVQYLQRLGITQSAATALTVAGDPRSQKRIQEQNNTITASKGIDEVNTDIQNTVSGKWDQVKAQMTDFGVVIGDKVLPALKSLLSVMVDILGAAKKFAEDNPMTASLIAAEVAVLGVIAAFKAMNGVMGTVGSASSVLKALATNSSSAAVSVDGVTESTRRYSAAQIDQLKNVARVTDATKIFTQARLAEAQAHVESMSGMQRLTAVQNVLIPAQQAAAQAATDHTAAQTKLTEAQKSASVVSRTLSGALGLVGGPIGAITLALTVAAAAWEHFGTEASKAAAKAEKASEDALSALREGNKRLDDEYKAMTGVDGKNGKVTGSDAVDISKSRDAIANIKERLAKSKEMDQLVPEGPDGVSFSKTKRLQKELDEAEKNLQERLDKVERNADLIRKKRAEEDKKVEEDMKGKGLGGSSKAKSGVGGYYTAADAKVEDAAGNPDKKSKRDRIDPLDKALNEAQGKVASQKIKLDSLVAGTKELSTLWDEAAAEVEGKRKAGDYNKDLDKKNQVSADDPRIAQMTEALYQEKLLAEQTKAVQFANERSAASTSEANAAMERISQDGAPKQTDAFRALTRELERAEERLGAGASSLQKWKSAKDDALAKQAGADLMNYAADESTKAKQTNAKYGYSTDRERLQAERDEAARSEDAKYTTLVNNLNRMRAARIADANAEETDLISREARVVQINKEADDQISLANQKRLEALEAQGKETKRLLETPVQSLAREWKDTTKQMETASASWANGFLDTLTTALTTGKLNWRSFVSGMANDLMKMTLKKTFGDSITGMFGSLGDSFMKLFKGGSSAAGGAAADAVGGLTASGAKAPADALLGSFKNLSTVSDTAKDSMTEMVDDGVTKTTESLVEGVAQDTAKMTQEQLASVAVQSMAESALTAAEALVTLAASSTGSSGGLGGLAFLGAGAAGGAGAAAGAGASSGAVMAGETLTMAKNGAAFDGSLSFFKDGGAFTNSLVDSPTLFKFANGGKFGVMGEAGPEAVMPLTRDGNGRLGVSVIGGSGGGNGNSDAAQGGGQNINIEINVNSGASGTASNQTSTDSTGGNDTSMWQSLAQKVKVVVVQEIVNQTRPGGVLYK